MQWRGGHYYTLPSVERANLVAHGWRIKVWACIRLQAGEAFLFTAIQPLCDDRHPQSYAFKAENDHLVSVSWLEEGVAW